MRVNKIVNKRISDHLNKLKSEMDAIDKKLTQSIVHNANLNISTEYSNKD